MDGPIAALISSVRLPKDSCMRSTMLAAILATVPFQLSMRQPGNFFYRIIKKQRHAIGIKGRQQHARYVGQQPIRILNGGFPAQASRPRQTFVNDRDIGAVDLFPACPCIERESELSLQ